ncbi:ImmA/IrrE family metallo-endopeptidase [Psychromicrobium xiongbiense]|uniref:ImmA/IrrE family metallo-endopeptidase n=1 Tax=Psychromicrobium xiongbiense TaxID=3051184 RepID=UPI002553A95F|nr:ImmA/IrrE family metallo-endopeptidase [Psychromicrobium sp. YIM S02556]
MTQPPTTFTTERSVLASLRTLIPQRTVTSQAEALRIAEHQATKLIDAFGITDGPVPVELIGELPKIRIEYVTAPVSGASFWNGDEWIIQLNKYENWTRQRFTLAHEYKHIIDHNHADHLYTGTRRATPQEQAEHAADYFAGCLLIPKPMLKRVFCSGIQDPADLADHFNVSEAAIRTRLQQTSLIDQPPRCATTSTPFSRGWQYRANRTRYQGA